MAASYQSYKVVKGDGNSHAPTDDFITAVQASFNNIGDSTYNAWGDDEIFDPSKIQQTGAASGDWLAWDGAKWDNATPAATTAVVLSDTTLTAPSASFDFTSLSASYKHLLVLGTLRSDRIGSNDDDLGVRFNADTGSNYDGYAFQMQGTTPDVAGNENRAATSAILANIVATDDLASDLFTVFEFRVPHYAGAANNKIFNARCNLKIGTTTGKLNTFRGVGAWRANTAISRITLIPIHGTNFKTGSRVTVFGY